MKQTTKTLTRAGIIASLYIVLTLICLPIAYGPWQLRIGEGLAVLPVFFPESSVALFVGCFVANLFSSYGVIDSAIGGVATLVSAVLTWLIYKKTKNVYISLIPPVVVNALLVPLTYLIVGSAQVYYIDMLSIFLMQSVCVYGFGLPIYFKLKKEKDKGSRLF